MGYNGLEVAIDDTRGAGYHDTGAIYDLVRPDTNAMKLAGAWNHLRITCDRSLIQVEVNGQRVTRIDLDDWTAPNRRPDGSAHKFDIAYKNHPRLGYIGLQDHGGDCWFRNLKLRPLNVAAGMRDRPATERAEAQSPSHSRRRGLKPNVRFALSFEAPRSFVP